MAVLPKVKVSLIVFISRASTPWPLLCVEQLKAAYTDDIQASTQITPRHLRRQHPDIYADDIQASTQTTFSTVVATHDDHGLDTDIAA